MVCRRAQAAPPLDRRALREAIDRRGLAVELEVDGGVHAGTAAQVVEAGARVLVAGSAVFGAVKAGEEISFDQRVQRYAEAIAKIRAAAPPSAS